MSYEPKKTRIAIHESVNVPLTYFNVVKSIIAESEQCRGRRLQGRSMGVAKALIGNETVLGLLKTDEGKYGSWCVTDKTKLENVVRAYISEKSYAKRSESTPVDQELVSNINSAYIKSDFPYVPLKREDEQRIGRDMIAARGKFVQTALQNPYIAHAIASALAERIAQKGASHVKYWFDDELENERKRKILFELREYTECQMEQTRKLEKSLKEAEPAQKEQIKKKFVCIQEKLDKRFKDLKLHSGMLAARVAKYCSDDKLLCELSDVNPLRTEEYKIYQESRSRLYHSIARLGMYQARKYANSQGRIAEFDDLSDIASEGCLEAIDTWDPGKNCKISTHAMWRIKQKLGRDEQKHLARVSESPRLLELLKIAKREAYEFEKETGREPDLSEFSQMLGIDAHLALTLQQFMRTKSLDDIVGEDGTLGAIVGKEDQSLSDFESGADAKVLWKKVKDIVSPKEYTILRRMYVESKTLDEVGSEMGISRERVRQYKVKALNRLKYAFPRGTITDESGVSDSGYDCRKKIVPFVREVLTREFGKERAYDAHIVSKKILSMSCNKDVVDTRVINGRKRNYVKNEKLLRQVIHTLLNEPLAVPANVESKSAKRVFENEPNPSGNSEGRESLQPFLRLRIAQKTGLEGVSLEKELSRVRYRLLGEEQKEGIFEACSRNGTRYEYFVDDEDILIRKVDAILKSSKRRRASQIAMPQEIPYPELKQFVERILCTEKELNDTAKKAAQEYIVERILVNGSQDAVLKWTVGDESEFYVKNPKLVEEHITLLLRIIKSADSNLKPAS